MLNDSVTDTRMQTTHGPGFTIGLLTGGIVGAVLALAFAPRAGADLRRSVASAAKNLGSVASDHYQDASALVGDAVAQLGNKARTVRDYGAEAVVSNADDIARFARSTTSGERPQPSANRAL
jgi:gas vesicle protein